jgi:hypothetical protein
VTHHRQYDRHEPTLFSATAPTSKTLVATLIGVSTGEIKESEFAEQRRILEKAGYAGVEKK